MKEIRKIVTVLLLSISIMVCIATPVRAMEELDDSDLYAKAAVLMDANSGRVLYEKNGSDILPMASTTKIMTCILALELGDLEDLVTISDYASIQPKVKLFATAGDQIVLEDLLYSLMLESHNDSAVAIAEHIGYQLLGKERIENTKEESMEAVAAFADEMNKLALRIGCEDTYYITPNGLDATETFQTADGQVIEMVHSTTATDLAKVMSYCVLHSSKSEMFLEITSSLNHGFQNVSGTKQYSLSNHNAFLGMMSGALSGKTGYTSQASYCYVGALERDGRTYVVALLHCGTYGNKTLKWNDTKLLMEYGINYFQNSVIYDRLEIADILVEQGKPDIDSYFEGLRVPVFIEDNETLEMLLSDEDKYEVKVSLVDTVKAPISKGEIVGKVSILLNGEVWEEKDIILARSVEQIQIWDHILYLMKNFFKL